METRPTVRLPDKDDEDGNVFSIIARVSRALKKAGMRTEAEKFTSAATKAYDYEAVLSLVGDYVEIE